MSLPRALVWEVPRSALTRGTRSPKPLTVGGNLLRMGPSPQTMACPSFQAFVHHSCLLCADACSGYAGPQVK